MNKRDQRYEYRLIQAHVKLSEILKMLTSYKKRVRPKTVDLTRALDRQIIAEFHANRR